MISWTCRRQQREAHHNEETLGKVVDSVRFRTPVFFPVVSVRRLGRGPLRRKKDPVSCGPGRIGLQRLLQFKNDRIPLRETLGDVVSLARARSECSDDARLGCLRGVNNKPGTDTGFSKLMRVAETQPRRLHRSGNSLSGSSDSRSPDSGMRGGRGASPPPAS